MGDRIAGKREKDREESLAESDNESESLLGKRAEPEEDKLVVPQGKRVRVMSDMEKAGWTKGSVFNGCVFNMSQ